MKKLSPSIHKPLTHLFYLLALTCAFLLLEISFFIVCNDHYLGDFSFVASQIAVPPAIWPEVYRFAAVQCLLHLGFCLLAWLVAIYSGYLLKVQPESQFNYAVTVWCVLLVTVFILNQVYFPNSKFADLSSAVFFDPLLLALAAKLLTTCSVILCAAAISGFLVWIMDYSMPVFLVTLATVALSAWALHWQFMPQLIQVVKRDQPNVIIVGVDSLRPDYLSYFGSEQPTPFLDSYLQSSTVFTEAVTPLARTFPSWSSILLGQYPMQSGIRFNLANIETLDLQSALPRIFAKHGYETIYATDETRFSNIDQAFGFNQIIAPPAGLSDFLIGTFNDFPLSNLVINSALGPILFPYSYANRAAYITYQPDSFIKRMAPILLQPQQKPLFLAVHFCLPHFPFVYADFNGGHFANTVLYRASLQRVDKQVDSFFALLKKSGLLDNAIVVVLSDHGEALGTAGDRITSKESFIGQLNQAGQTPRFYPASKETEAVNQSAGHGTDVLGLPQYHSLLAFRLYGRGVQQIGNVAGVVSLVGIKPALLKLAGIDAKDSPIADIVLSKASTLQGQHVFLESDYSPAAIRTVYPEVSEVLLEGAHLFEINPTNLRIQVRPDMGIKIIQSKQYADIYQGWMLALYPNQAGSRTAILINLKTGQWTDNLSNTFAERSPAAMMLKELHTFFHI